MRIGIDARFYGAKMQGLGRYTLEIIDQLSRLDRENLYFLFVLSDTVVPVLPYNFQVVRVTYRWYGFKEQLHWPWLLYRYKLDMMHFVHFNVPILYRRAYLLTIHDLILLHYPSIKSSTLAVPLYYLKYALYRLVIRNAVRSAKRIIAISHFTKRDLVKMYNIRASKIEVIYNGLTIFPQNDSRNLILSEDIRPKKYFLYVGNAYPHKNLEFLVQCFHSWRERKKNDYKLVLVGVDDYFYRRLRANIDMLGIDNVILTNFVTDAVLAWLYRNASAFVFPSLYEGFGLPPLEAMSFDCPVVSSNRSAMPEILENAALFFDPTQEEDLASKLDAIISDDVLRHELCSRGRALTSKYDWRRSVKMLHTLYLDNKF